MRALLAKNLSWLFFDRVSRLGIGLWIGVWVARFLGPEQYGVLNYALSYVAIFSAFIKLPLDQIAIRELIEKPLRRKKILGTIFWLKFFSGLFGFIAIAAIIYLSSSHLNEANIAILILALSMLFNWADIFEIYFNAKSLPKYFVIAKGIGFILYTLARIALIYFKLPLLYFVASFLIECITSSLLLVLIFRINQGTFDGWRFDSKTVRQLLGDGWPVMVAALMTVIQSRLDQVMLGEMLGDYQVGIYSVAVRLSEIWIFVPMVIVQVLTPHLISLRVQSHSLFNWRMCQIYCFMFWAGVFVGIGVLLFGSEIILLTFGPDYLSAYSPLVVTIWSGIFISQSIARSIWLLGENIFYLRLVVNIISLPVNIGLNLLVIPKYGAEGAAYATLISTFFGVWVFPYFFKKLRFANIQMMKSINPFPFILK